MPYCVVKGCLNHSSKSKKQHGITYHRFPSRDQYTHMKEKWIEVIRASRHEPLWLPKSNSVVCSAHFKVDDLYNTQSGRCLVLQNGYPKIFPVIPERLQRKYLSQTPNVHQPAATTQSDDLRLKQPISICSNDDLTTVRVQSEQSSSNFDILKKHQLRTRVLYLQKKLIQKKKKIKTLNQNVRRLQKRNKSLKKVLDSLQNQNYINNRHIKQKKDTKKRNVLKTT